MRPSTPNRVWHIATSKHSSPRLSSRRCSTSKDSAAMPTLPTRYWTSSRPSPAPRTANWCTTHQDSCSTFEASTPVAEIGALNIGSRPASRKQTKAISDLRAIPWVLSWSQSRVMLPGWYGTGAAFERWIDGDDTRLATFDGPVREVAVLPNRALEHGHGDVEVGSRFGGPVRGPRARRRTARSSLRNDHRRARTHNSHVQGNHGQREPLCRQLGPRAFGPTTGSRTSNLSTIYRSS